MLFSLSNAPSAFQRLMNEVFADLLDMCVVIYLDDILIYSNSLEDHKGHVKEVLHRLHVNGLYASPSKCLFYKKKVEFLGFIPGPEGIQMDEEKVCTIKTWPTPCKVKDMQAFLGFTNFYRRFIYNYSKKSVPLTHLTKKNTSWNCNKDCQAVFDTLKEAFTSAPVLAHWDPEAPIMVETDASDYALAAILSTHINGDIHPIAFHSHTFNTAELNYDIHDKELLTVHEAFKKWQHYLEGTPLPVNMVTDHKNLTYFSGTKLLSQCQARWSEYLSQFNLTIRFRPGRLGTKPDALTR